MSRLLERAAGFASDRLSALVGRLLLLESRAAGSVPLADLARERWRRANQQRVRRQATAVRVSEGVALCRVLTRYKMFVDAGDHGLAAHLMLDGYWEMWVTQVVASLVKPGMVVADVGANQGYYTLLLADLVGPAGRVLAFEPNPAMTALLRRSLHTNGMERWVTLHTAPAGRGGGERVVLSVPPGTPSGAHLVLSEAADAVPTLSLDEALGETPLHLVKIDAEGWEMDVWDGMRGILSRGAPMVVVMEFVADRRPGAAAFLAEAAAMGFALWHADALRGLCPLAADAVLSAPQNQEWVLVLRRGM